MLLRRCTEGVRPLSMGMDLSLPDTSRSFAKAIEGPVGGKEDRPFFSARRLER